MATAEKAPDNHQWRDINAELPTRIEFDTHGDTFEGTYTHTSTATSPRDNEQFQVLHFKGADGNPYTTYPGVSLQIAFREIKPGSYVRMTYARDEQTNQPSPMKIFKVQVRR